MLCTNGTAAPHNRLLAALPEEDRHYLGPHIENIQLPRGRVVCGFGDTLRYTYFPNDSVIGFLVEMEDGRSAETANVGCEGAAGHVAALGSRRSSSHHLVQISGTAARIKTPTLVEAFERQPGLRKLLRHYAEALLVQVQQSAACNALHAVKPRLSRWILTMQDRSGGDTVRLTHEFMAQMLGVHRSTVTTTALSLQDAGVIAYRHGVLSVLDRAGLTAESCECYDIVRTEFERLLPLTYGGAQLPVNSSAPAR